MRRKSILCLILVMLLCSLINMQDVSAASKKKKVGFDKKSITITVGTKKNLKFKNPEAKVKWSVSNKKNVKLIQKKGAKKNIAVIKGKKKGKSKITAKCGGKKYSIKIIVNPKTTKKVVDETNKETIEKETAASETIKATVVKNKISKTEDLEILFEATGEKTYYFGEEPGKLEKKEENAWIEIKHKNDIEWIEIAYLLSRGKNQKLSVPLNYYYGDMMSGYYRYTKEISGINITVEFEIIEDSEPLQETVEKETIKATVVKNKISKTEDLEILFEATGEKTYCFGEEPGKLEKKEENAWIEIKHKNDIEWIEIAYLLSYGKNQKLSVPLNYYYGDMMSGYYRYTKEISGINITVEFEIVDDSEPLKN